MKEYTAKEMSYSRPIHTRFKVTQNKLYFTAEFKEAFWMAYQAGVAPRKIIEDLGYDLEMFGQNRSTVLSRESRNRLMKEMASDKEKIILGGGKMS